MRTISWFSCGAASAVATKLALKTHVGAKEDFIIARCFVAEEHPDNERFSTDCARWFNHPITTLTNDKYAGSVFEVIRQTRYISGPAGAPCTRLLKKAVRESFQEPTDTHVFGYTYEETDRYDRFLDANNIKTLVPLIEQKITHAETLGILQQANIDLPALYKLGYKHNNCIGCVKSTSPGYWNKVRRDFPERFAKMAAISDKLGVRMISAGGSRLFLSKLHPDKGNYADEPDVQCGAFCETHDWNPLTRSEEENKP